MTGGFMAKRVKKHLRSSMMGGLAFCVAFSGIPGPHSPEFLRLGEAAAQSASIVRITEWLGRSQTPETRPQQGFGHRPARGRP